jgi:hypothetical protein
VTPGIGPVSIAETIGNHGEADLMATEKKHIYYATIGSVDGIRK